MVVDVSYRNIEFLAEGADLWLDGTDNLETRYLINDVVVKTWRPWIYGAVIGVTGFAMMVILHDTRCLFEDAPPPEMSPRCDTAGALGPAVSLVAAFQAMEAVKLPAGRSSEINRHFLQIDAWTGRVANLNVQAACEKGSCPCCGRLEFPYLAGDLGGSSTTRCGRNVVLINRMGSSAIDLAAIGEKSGPVVDSPVRHNPFLLKAHLEGCEMTLFVDGRAIVKGPDDPAHARTLYAKYLGG